jgi:hypothetical protein
MTHTIPWESIADPSGLTSTARHPSACLQRGPSTTVRGMQDGARTWPLAFSMTSLAALSKLPVGTPEAVLNNMCSIGRQRVVIAQTTMCLVCYILLRAGMCLAMSGDMPGRQRMMGGEETCRANGHMLLTWSPGMPWMVPSLQAAWMSLEYPCKGLLDSATAMMMITSTFMLYGPILLNPPAYRLDKAGIMSFGAHFAQ